jgi:hypothetical protein
MKKILIICAVLILSMVMSQTAQAVMVPLVAGQDLLVGHVRVEINLDGDLEVEYLLDVDLECMELEFEEIHLHVAWQADLIPTNNKNLPQIGQFQYSSPLTVIDLDGDAIPGTPDTEVSIAAHAVVSSPSCDICEELTVGLIEELEIDYTELTGDSYFEITIGDTTYPVWCIDRDHSMSLYQGGYPFTLYDVRTYTAICDGIAYESFPTELSEGYGELGGVDRPENLMLVLWIINQKMLGNPVADDWEVGDIQWVIWHLMEGLTDDEPPVPQIPLQNEDQEAILAAAEAGVIDWYPGCCDYVGVILAPSLPLPDPLDSDDEVPLDDQVRQLAIMLIPGPCCLDETAWALSENPEGILFAPLNDKPNNTKRSGSWAEHFEFPIP